LNIYNNNNNNRTTRVMYTFYLYIMHNTRARVRTYTRRRRRRRFRMSRAMSTCSNGRRAPRWHSVQGRFRIIYYYYYYYYYSSGQHAVEEWSPRSSRRCFRGRCAGALVVVHAYAVTRLTVFSGFHRCTRRYQRSLIVNFRTSTTTSVS